MLSLSLNVSLHEVVCRAWQTNGFLMPRNYFVWREQTAQNECLAICMKIVWPPPLTLLRKNVSRPSLLAKFVSNSKHQTLVSGWPLIWSAFAEYSDLIHCVTYTNNLKKIDWWKPRNKETRHQGNCNNLINVMNFNNYCQNTETYISWICK